MSRGLGLIALAAAVAGIVVIALQAATSIDGGAIAIIGMAAGMITFFLLRGNENGGNL